MPENFHEKLINLLKTDPRFVDDEGELSQSGGDGSGVEDGSRPREAAPW